MLLVVIMLLETQSHALVTLTGLPVAVRQVEISYGEGSACALRVQRSQGWPPQHHGRAHPSLRAVNLWASPAPCSSAVC